MRELQKFYGGLGQFSIPKRLLCELEPGMMQTIMFGLIVVSAEHYWVGDRIVYRAFGPEFKEIDIGDMVPEYDVLITRDPIPDQPNAFQYSVKWTPKER